MNPAVALYRPARNQSSKEIGKQNLYCKLKPESLRQQRPKDSAYSYSLEAVDKLEVRLSSLQAGKHYHVFLWQLCELLKYDVQKMPNMPKTDLHPVGKHEQTTKSKTETKKPLA